MNNGDFERGEERGRAQIFLTDTKKKLNELKTAENSGWNMEHHILLYCLVYVCITAMAKRTNNSLERTRGLRFMAHREASMEWLCIEARDILILQHYIKLPYLFIFFPLHLSSTYCQQKQ